MNLYAYGADLIRVIDGDTYLLNIDCGFDTHRYTRVRLRGVNAAERFTAQGRAATAWVTEWFTEIGTVHVRTYKGDETDKYGRWVADIESPDGKRSLAAEMIDAGMATVYPLER